MQFSSHRSIWALTRNLLTVALLTIGLGSSSLTAQDDCYDQTNTINVFGGYVLPDVTMVGQTFVPTEHSIDTVDLHMSSQDATSGVVQVRLRVGGITGTSLGVSLPVTIDPPSGMSRRERFDFAQPVEVIPGSTYALELEHVSGGRVGVSLTDFNIDRYPHGTAIKNGVPEPEDLWFREGRIRTVSVPDQANVDTLSGSFAVPASGPVGQEFVPTRRRLEVVDLMVNAQVAATTVVQVNIRSNSIVGPIVATSHPVQVTGTTIREESFNFSSPVAVVPGSRYVIEVVRVSSVIGVEVSTTATASYPRGRAIVMGAPDASRDLWFELGYEGACDVCQRNLGYQGPGVAMATMCGTGLANGAFCDYRLSDAPASSNGVLVLSFAGQPNLSIGGGTLASGAGLVFTYPIATDNNGRFAGRFAGTLGVFDLAAQAVVIAPSIPTGLAFSNALELELGR